MSRINDTGDFWEALDRLAAEQDIVIDRPAGSHHPRLPDIVYPYDYGYFADTTSGDGQGIDCWRGSADRRVTAVILTYDGRKRDAELKVLIGCDPEQMDRIRALHSRGDQTALLVRRDKEM